MRKSFVVLALGLGFLVGITWLGTIITNIIPRKATPPIQRQSAGPYQVVLNVQPNPPLLTQPALLSVSIVDRASQKPVTDARVRFATTMETMDMGTDRVDAQSGGGGTYQSQIQFSMSGPWKVAVGILRPGQVQQQVEFEITAQ